MLHSDRCLWASVPGRRGVLWDLPSGPCLNLPYRARIPPPSLSPLLQEARLLWLQGQQQLALQIAKGLVEDMCAALGRERERGQPQGGGRGRGVENPHQRAETGVDRVQLAVAMSLAGKWMAEVQQAGGGGTAVLEYLKKAAGYLPAPPAAGRSGSRSPDLERVSCKLLYRLGSYADARYREICAQKAAPEFALQARVMEIKRQEVAELQRKLKSPSLTELYRRNVAYEIPRRQRPVDMDEVRAG